MDYDEENPVETGDDTEVDDALPDGIEEEADDGEESLEDLDVLADEEQPEEETPEEQPQQPEPSEPGWIKQRVNKAVQKAIAETEARMQAMFDQQMAPIREKMLNDEAKELVRQGEFKSLDRAKEYLQLKQGITPTPQPQKQQQPRDDQGRYTPKDDPVISAKIDMLAHQADTIKERTGVDVIAEFNANPEIKQAVINGEIDFYDVAEMMKPAKPKKSPPSPMRSPNGASGGKINAIDSMSDEQFRRMEKRIQEGARYSLK